MADRILIWGAGGHGRVVADLVRLVGHRVRGYIDRNASALSGSPWMERDCVLIEETEWLAEMSRRREARGFDALVLGIGNNAARKACFDQCAHVPMPVLVHPAASMSSSASADAGTVVLAAAVVNAGARVGRAVIVNTGSIVEHDCVIGDGAHISPGAVVCGGVRVGRGAWIGAAAVVTPNRCIGDNAVVGAGAVVIRDVPDGMTMAGNPARALHVSVEVAS